MAQRAEDDGKSEGPAVMAGIGIETENECKAFAVNIMRGVPFGKVRRALPTSVWRFARKNLSAVQNFFFTKAAGKHMDTGLIIPALYMLTGRNASGAEAAASKSLWFLLAWGPIEESVRTLQVRIAKAAKTNKWRKVSSANNADTDPPITGQSDPPGWVGI